MSSLYPDSRPLKAIPYVYDDGGRREAGFKGDTGDCVTRAIAIATGVPYREVYDALFASGRSLLSEKPGLRGSASPRSGVLPEVYKPYIEGLGWAWTPTMKIGTGTHVHVDASELPTGRLILRLSRHLAAVIDGVLHDTFDCSRGGTRAVYGYWSQP